MRLTQYCAAAFGMVVALVTSAAGANAEDLYKKGDWAAMASDRLAGQVGDTLTVLVYETSSASNSAQSATGKATALSGQVSKGASGSSGQLGLSSTFAGGGQTGRSDKMVAQISVTVDGVFPNGDLHVGGEQLLNINGEKTKIKIKGRVRRADIFGNNTVISSRLADAEISYNGRGFVSHSAALGFLNRIFEWLGVE